MVVRQGGELGTKSLSRYKGASEELDTKNNNNADNKQQDARHKQTDSKHKHAQNERKTQTRHTDKAHRHTWARGAK